MMFTIIRFAIGIIILSIGAYTDIKTRTASNILWVVLGDIAIILLVTEFYIDGIDYMKIIIIAGLILVFYVLFQFRVIRGGADAKAIMCLSVLIPSNVLDVFFLSALSMIASIPVVCCYKKISIKDALFKYQYPALVSYLSGFILSFFLTGFWNDPLLQNMMMHLYGLN